MITLRVWGGVPAEAGPQASIDLFNEAFKDKGIRRSTSASSTTTPATWKLETSLLAGNDVDLYMTYTPAVLQKRASGNMALDLTELVERDGFDIEGIFGKMALAYYIDGKPYSLPTKMDQYGIVINKDMFDAAGIEVPTEWSFEEFREIARKLTHGEGDSKVYGMFFNSQQDLLYPFNYFSVQTLGGDPLYHADGTANVNDPVNVAAIELVNNMMNVDHTAPTHTDSVTQKLSQEGMFITGKSAMTIGPWMVRSIKDRDNYPHDFKTAFAPHPTIDGVRTYTQGGYGDHLCINPKSKHIDAAWEFMKWYATEGMLPLTSGGRVPSANTYDSVEVTEYFPQGRRGSARCRNGSECVDRACEQPCGAQHHPPSCRRSTRCSPRSWRTSTPASRQCSRAWMTRRRAPRRCWPSNLQSDIAWREEETSLRLLKKDG